MSARASVEKRRFFATPLSVEETAAVKEHFRALIAEAERNTGAACPFAAFVRAIEALPDDEKLCGVEPILRSTVIEYVEKLRSKRGNVNDAQC